MKRTVLTIITLLVVLSLSCAEIPAPLMPYYTGQIHKSEDVTWQQATADTYRLVKIEYKSGYSHPFRITYRGGWYKVRVVWTWRVTKSDYRKERLFR